ncbi:MAG: DUF1508 domain-containing protein [Candidatus Methanomethylophilaceae archaeon]|nr:DUF1508 domain-containing protein [Candidatus Methanomethylophilaceae archaeon]MBQ7404989.1 DUF1508 domain-containing protein [Candidatus Methanomethylophilaceae archaeon]MBQ8643576.1 DUF1508 domain-containing protein [Candidatus Methanomethylophilaceae archaeon]MBR2348971.1 DUF1508 domain-containing protein [Candidatus Methanomethylophilaceae archaeon]
MSKFVVKKTKNDGYMFTLHDDEGEVLGRSQVYRSIMSAENGIQSVKKNLSSDILNLVSEEHEPVKNPRWEIYKDTAGEFRFRLRASNGEIVLSSNAYPHEVLCMDGISRARGCAENARMLHHS